MPEYLLVKYHRGAIIAGVEGDFSRPSQATLQYELYLLLPVKPQSQGAYRAFFQAQQQELDDTNRALRGESPSPEQ
mgnify:FL=1